MKEEIGLRGSKYGIIAVCTSISLLLLIVCIIRFTSNPAVVGMLINLFHNFPLPIIIGILSLFFSAYYFGKKAGFELARDNRLGSSVGLTTALKVLTVLALAVAWATVIQISWQGGFSLLFSIFYLLRVAVPVFLLGLPFAFLMGYGFGTLLKNKLINNKT
ncbi:hypothetical protein [Rufibacter immobilis]|uniref:hypothetical protein n=1 Tax=Rufibacter immobilis TaxID=1348778 RepID=UPI0035EC5FAF